MIYKKDKEKMTKVEGGHVFLQPINIQATTLKTNKKNLKKTTTDEQERDYCKGL